MGAPGFQSGLFSSDIFWASCAFGFLICMISFIIFLVCKCGRPMTADGKVIIVRKAAKSVTDIDDDNVSDTCVSSDYYRNDPDSQNAEEVSILLNESVVL